MTDRHRGDLLRQVGLGLGVMVVLSCVLIGGGLLTIRESARSALRPTSTPFPTSLVVPTPRPTPTPSPAAPTVATTATPLTATPTPAAGSPTATPSPTSTRLPSPTATYRPPCRPPAGWQPYTVRKGDTLTLLAWRYGTTVAAIVQANCLSGTAIVQGQRIYLPPRPARPTATATRCVPHPPAGWVLYTVQPGDTLYGLALRHRTTLVRIREVNCLRGYDVYAGQRLYLPPLPPTATPTWTLVPTATPTVAPTPSPTTTVIASPTATEVPSPTPAPTPTSTPTVAPSPTVTIVPSPTPAPTTTSTPTTATTPTTAPTSTAISTPTAAVASPTPTVPTSTPTPSPTATELPTATPAPTPTPTTNS